MVNRRLFLAQSGTLISSLYSLRTPLLGAPKFGKDPFTLGVASGDPTASGVVLWTRLAPEPLAETGTGGMENAAVEVEWRIAEDERLSKGVKRGRAIATPNLGHSVHVEVEGLRPDRWYWYQFKAGNYTSPVGRTRTMPAAGAKAARLQYTFASCQHWEAGLWTAYEHMAKEELDLVIHLGDYIYEGPARSNGVRKHQGPEITTLSHYRNRHALYKSDPALQKVHQMFPWVVTWDDHEVDNNYAGDVAEDKQTRAELLERRANAYQAYYENMPLRAAALPKGSAMLLYRTVDFGDLARFAVLDTRQYRTDQPCGDGNKGGCREAFDPQATILGAAQREWLFGTLGASRARWNVVAQQVLMAKIDTKAGEEEAYSMDQWSGYEADRKKVLDFFAQRKPSNPIVITGDIHSNWVADLKMDWKDERSATVGTEFVGTSISSGGDGAEERPTTQAQYRENPHLKWFNGQRGYVKCTVTPAEYRADYRVVPYVLKPGAPVATRSSWTVENGRAGVKKS